MPSGIYQRPAVAERFWAKVDLRGPDECWLWTASQRSTGYGCTWSGGGPNGRNLSAHRVAYELCVGAIPDGMLVCHRCDVRLCCNPAHLFLGTCADNHADMDAKGRRVNLAGEAHACAKLTLVMANEIRRLPGTQRQIAAQFGVSQQTVSLIKSGHRWKASQAIA